MAADGLRTSDAVIWGGDKGSVLEMGLAGEGKGGTVTNKNSDCEDTHGVLGNGRGRKSAIAGLMAKFCN